MFVFFFPIQITDYKNINEIVFICPEAALKIQKEYNDVSARLYSARPPTTLMLADVKEHDTCTLTRSHTPNQSFEHRGMRQQEAEIISSVLQRGLGGFSLLLD